MVTRAPVTGRAKGGIARAKQLSAKERKDIAKRAAATRWGDDNLPRAICSSEDTPLRIAEHGVGGVEASHHPDRIGPIIHVRVMRPRKDAVRCLNHALTRAWADLQDLVQVRRQHLVR